MKKIILLSGCQGSGKTTLVNDYGLHDHVVSMDAFRRLFSPPLPTLDGAPSLSIGQDAERHVKAAARAAVEHRLSMGATVVIDAMNLSTKTQGSWAELGLKYGYETLLIDVQGDLTDDELLQRNAGRHLDRVHEQVVLKMAELGRTRPLHEKVRRIAAEDLPAELSTEVVNLSDYSRVVVVGDVHSCAAPLRDVIAEHGGLERTDTAWIFLGDLFDRGPNAAEVFELLLQPRPNVFMIEGNHETSLRLVMNGLAAKNKFEQSRRTREQIVSAGHAPREIVEFLGRLRPYMIFDFAGQRMLATHGGVKASDVLDLQNQDGTYRLWTLPDRHFIYGDSDRDKTFMRHSTYDHVDHLLADTGLIQLHGHRNGGHHDEPQPMGAVEGVWNLEGGVESGGHLRVAVIDVRGHITGHEYDSPVPAPERTPGASVSDQLAAHPDIRTKDIGAGITAYNFTRDAFSKGRWDSLSTAARGLFMRGEKVVARGYEKFFNMGERCGFTREQVLSEFIFPVRVSEKANGFLLIASSIDGELVLFSKSGPTDFSQAGQRLFEEVFDAQRREAFRALLERTDTSVTFEAILANDPHLVDYGDVEKIEFLDVIENSIDFRIRTDLEAAVTSVLGIERVASTVVTSTQDLDRLIFETETGGGEGAVLRDAQGRMTKIKAEGYSAAKRLRGALTRVLSGKAESLPTGTAQMAAWEAQLRSSGVWDRLEEFTVVNPTGQRVLHMPRILAASGIEV